MREIDKIANNLFEKIRSRFRSVNLGDENAKSTQDPEQARFFNFDYDIDNTSMGNVTISLIDEKSLKVYFGTDIIDNIKEAGLDKDKWYDFLRSLRNFAKRNMLNFDTRDITKSNLQLKDIRQQSKSDATLTKDEVQMTESRRYGTSRHSFEDVGTCRLRIVHSENIDEEQRGARTRKIDAVFVETPRGERFRMDHNNLSGSAAIARHLSHDGEYGDEVCEAINGMMSEMSSMSHFVRSVKRRQFEDTETDQMAQAAISRYYELKDQLKRLRSPRHYLDFVENYMPEGAAEDEYDVDALRERFVKKMYDERFEQALPYVHRAHKKQEEAMNNSMAEEFENWADSVLEGTWAVPEKESDVEALRKLMSKPLLVGQDGMDATSALYSIIGDDGLFDDIHAMADVKGPDYDCRADIVNWLQDHFPALAQEMEQVMASSETPENPAMGTEPVLGTQQPAEKAAAATQQTTPEEPQPAQPVMQGADPLDFIRALAGLRR
jgi:hypothetical protein